LTYRAIALLAGDVTGYRNRDRVEESPDTRLIEPPQALREMIPDGLGLSADFLKSTGRKDAGARWPSEILQYMGTGGQSATNHLRAGGDKRVFSMFHFRSGTEIEPKGEASAEKRKWELTYLRARSAMFDKQHPSATRQ
jgi:hypothetical protein